MKNGTDWKAGRLLGSAYAIVVEGKVVMTRPEKEQLRELWARSLTMQGAPAMPLPESVIKQICFVLPPWEDGP